MSRLIRLTVVESALGATALAEPIAPACAGGRFASVEGNHTFGDRQRGISPDAVASHFLGCERSRRSTLALSRSRLVVRIAISMNVSPQWRKSDGRWPWPMPSFAFRWPASTRLSNLSGASRIKRCRRAWREVSLQGTWLGNPGSHDGDARAHRIGQAHRLDDERGVGGFGAKRNEQDLVLL